MNMGAYHVNPIIYLLAADAIPGAGPPALPPLLRPPLPLAPLALLAPVAPSAARTTPTPSPEAPPTGRAAVPETTPAAGGDAGLKSPAEQEPEPEAEPEAETDATAETEEEKARRLLYCSLCKVAVNSASQLEAHNSGKGRLRRTVPQMLEMLRYICAF